MSMEKTENTPVTEHGNGKQNVSSKESSESDR